MTRCPLILITALTASSVLAEEPGTRPIAPTEAFSLVAAPNSVDQDLADAAARPAGLLRYGPVSLIDPVLDRMNEALDPIGLKIGFAYTVVFQAASGGPGDRSAAGGDVDLFGEWRLLGAKDGQNNGYLYFAAEQRHQFFTDIAPAALRGEIGSLWGTTDGFGEQDLTVRELYWQQHFGGDALVVRVGKLDAENYYNSNYWQSASKFFINEAFASFPVRAFPGNGLGINVTAKLNEDWYISTGAQDAQGRKTTVGFDTLVDDFNLFAAFEVGYTPMIPGLGRGAYRLTAWYRDAGKSDGTPHDSGFDLSFDQRVGPHLIPFFRAGTSEGNINGIEHMISGGVGWEHSLITASDVFGIGGAWGRPADHDLDDQFATEVFYRLQVSPDNQFTIGYQLIFEPANQPDDDVVGVFELRWRITM